jgi:Mn2+/Fe2+ NRAMP family transporter
MESSLKGGRAMSDEKTKRLNLMKFWLFGTFIIIFAAATAYVGIALGTGLQILGQLNYWIAIIITAVLCVAFYYGYKWWLDRKQE